MLLLWQHCHGFIAMVIVAKVVGTYIVDTVMLLLETITMVIVFKYNLLIVMAFYGLHIVIVTIVSMITHFIATLTVAMVTYLLLL